MDRREPFLGSPAPIDKNEAAVIPQDHHAAFARNEQEVGVATKRIKYGPTKKWEIAAAIIFAVLVVAWKISSPSDQATLDSCLAGLREAARQDHDPDWYQHW